MRWNGDPARLCALTRSLKIKEDLAAKGYDAARPALTADGTMSEASQKKALDMVLKSAGVKEAPPLDRFFNFATTRKVNAELQGERLETGTKIGSQAAPDRSKRSSRL